MRELKRTQSLKDPDKIDRLLESVLQLIEYQERFVQQLEPILQLHRSNEEALKTLTVRVEELTQAQARTEKSVEELTQAQARTEKRLDSLATLMAELAESQKRTDAYVRELAQAQARTEKRGEEFAQAQTRTEARLEELVLAQARTEKSVEELALAQARTEKRVEELTQAQARTEKRLEELAQAQARTEKRVEELALAQARTEKRVEELAQAQARTEKRVEELALAQARTEKRVEELAQAQARTEKRIDRTNTLLGNLSMSFGYLLENQTYIHIPPLLAKEHGITIQGKLFRTHIADITGQYIEVNILGKGVKNGSTYFIVGESKAQLSRNDIDRFIRKKLQRIAVPEGSILFPLLVCHMTSSPEVEEYAREEGIAVFYSYQFD